MTENFIRGTWYEWAGTDNLGRRVEVCGIEYNAEYVYEPYWDEEGRSKRLAAVNVELTGHDAYYVDDVEVEEDVPDYILDAIVVDIEERLMDI